MMNDDDDDASTAAKILRSLDVVLFEINRIESLWMDTPRDVTNTAILHEARRRTTLLFDEANKFFEWVTSTRLIPPVN